MGKFQVIKEFMEFLCQEKKYWLVPLAVMMLLLGLLMIFAHGSAVAPFIYTLF